MGRFGRIKRRGANAIEFGLIALPLTMIVLGTMEYGWLLFNQIMVDSVAREGARIASRTALASAESEGEAAAAAFWNSLGIPGSPEFDADIIEVDGVRLVEFEVDLDYTGLMGAITPVPDDLAATITIRHEIQP